MALPCVNDSCTIIAGVDGAGRLDLDARIDPNGGLTCTSPNLGLATKIDPNSCNHASVSAAGILVPSPGFQIHDIAGTRTHFSAHPTNYSAASTDYSVTNNSASCCRYVQVSFVWNLAFNVAHNAIYVADGTFRLRVFTTGGTNGSCQGNSGLAATLDQIADSFNIGGPAQGGAGTDYKSLSYSRTVFYAVAPNQTIRFIADARIDSNNLQNVITNTGTDTGIITGGKLVMMDITPATLFT